MVKSFFCRYFIFLFLLFVSFLHVFPQAHPVEIKRSEEKVLIDGELYYIHTVQPGQTTYSISRAYGVTEQDIAAANPNVLLEKINVGQALRIPVRSKAPELSENYFDLSKRDFIYHKVKQGQTVFFLSKKYNVTQEIIYEYNPEAQFGLQIDQVIKIPKKNVLLKKYKNQFDENPQYIYYEIKAKDTLYSLAKIYGITVADIINFNEELRWGPKVGQLIRIPKPSYLLEIAEIDTITTDSIKIKMLSVLQCDSLTEENKHKVFKVALMLPFYSDYNEVLPETRLNSDQKTTENTEVQPVLEQNINRGRNYIEFYEGMLLAIDSLKKEGMNVMLYVYDTRRDTLQMKKILEKLEIIQPDLLVGPVYHLNLKLAAKFALEHRINLISPLSGYEIILKNNPYVYKILPSMESDLFYYAEFLSDYHDKNIILVHNEDSSGMKEIDKLKQFLFFHLTSNSTFDSSVFKEVRFNDTLTGNLRLALIQEKENLVIIASTNEAYVSDVLTVLNNDLKYYNITVTGFPAWQRFKKLQLEYFHNLELKLYTPFYVDYTNSFTRAVINKFRSYYFYEPTRLSTKGFYYGLLGFDVSYYFLNALRHYGNQFQNCISYQNNALTLGLYQFYRDNESDGFTNSSINIISYSKDFGIEKYPFHFKADPRNISISSDKTNQSIDF